MLHCKSYVFRANELYETSKFEIVMVKLSFHVLIKLLEIIDMNANSNRWLPGFAHLQF